MNLDGVYDMEDEVDWSDGSLDDLQAPSGELYSILPQIPSVGHDPHLPNPPGLADNNCSDADLLAKPTGEEASNREPIHDQGNHSVAAGVFSSTTPRARLRPSRRRPSRQDLMNFSLYQASQKTYEAMFLKNFIAHGLHPDKLGGRSTSEMKSYLQWFTNNANGIIEKMIRNSHSRTVNLLSHDLVDTPFLDIDQHGGDAFGNLTCGPGNKVQVAHRMNESWHRAYDFPVMVRYSARDYPIGAHRSPFEDMDETAHLFKRTPLPIGRVVKPPVRNQSKSRALVGAIDRNSGPTPVQGNWLPVNVAPYTEEESRLSSWRYLKSSRKTQPPSIQVVNNAGVLGPALMAAVESASSQMNASQHEPKFLVHDDVKPSTHVQEAGRSNVRPFWKTKLIDDHNRCLSENGHHPPSQPQRPQSMRRIVEHAVARKLLKSPSLEQWRQIDLVTAKQLKTQYRSALACRGAGKMDRNSSILGAASKPLMKRGRKKQLGESVGSEQSTEVRGNGNKVHNQDTPRKRYKISKRSAHDTIPFPPHSSGSKTLEPNQDLPQNAYFNRKGDEEPAWRCGIKHAMGYYYNAGDKRSCKGCNTNIRDQEACMKKMDFYLPSKTWSFQHAPGLSWKPSKLKKFAITPQCRQSHNSIAKSAYWEAIGHGATEVEARVVAVKAVENQLLPKLKRSPSPEAILDPTPEPIDLGPHPSGSKVLEHSQALPQGAYFEKRERHEEFAWRCDVNHALGRYYLAGCKKTCPGCGSSKTGTGRHAVMDFYLEPGMVIQQEASGLVAWKPTTHKTKMPSRRKQVFTHNQMCSRNYAKAVNDGEDHEKALVIAINTTAAELEAQLERRLKKHAITENPEYPESHYINQVESENDTRKPVLRRDQTGPAIISLVPRKRGHIEGSDRDDENSDEDVEGEENEAAHEGVVPETVRLSSEGESSSSSDSE